jgi:GTP-binding protein HflX
LTIVSDFEKESRSSLRRVPGLSTELEDVKEVEYREVRLERVVLVGVWTSSGLEAAEASMAELARLASTAGSVVVDAFIQRRDKPDPATYIGSGKAQAIAEVVRKTKADTVICDGELTLGQLRNLEDIVKVRVVDRTWLILDIFAQHAKSREGKAQVSLAQLEYLLPRLRGWGETLSRQAGRIGTRGPGETKLESDRRRVRDQMVRLRKQLKQMSKARETQKRSRHRKQTPSVAIVGYTNAGKSSLLNALTGAKTLVDDSLFATLDPTVRQLYLPSLGVVTLTDTVGFVKHLPHELVEAFRSSLEEVSDAHLLVHVVDASDSQAEAQILAVHAVLSELEVGATAILMVFNKIDRAEPAVVERLRRNYPDSLAVSVLSGVGIAGVRLAIEAKLQVAVGLNLSQNGNYSS